MIAENQTPPSRLVQRHFRKPAAEYASTLAISKPGSRLNRVKHADNSVLACSQHQCAMGLRRVYSDAAIRFRRRSHTPACSNSIPAFLPELPLARSTSGTRSRGGGSTYRRMSSSTPAGRLSAKVGLPHLSSAHFNESASVSSRIRSPSGSAAKPTAQFALHRFQQRRIRSRIQASNPAPIARKSHNLRASWLPCSRRITPICTYSFLTAFGTYRSR